MSIPQRFMPSVDELRRFYVGKTTHDIPKPAVVLDRAKVRRNCESMLDAVRHLGLDFRPHVKTHKTAEGTRLQLGQDLENVKIVVSTLPEIDHLMPLLQTYQKAGASVNVLYGIPLPPSQVPRLAEFGTTLGDHGLSVLIDHSSQLKSVSELHKLSKTAIDVFLKIDTGYHRAGLPPSKLDKDNLLQSIVQLESRGEARLLGFYSHSSLSYKNTTSDQAMEALESEIQGCLDALANNSHLFPKERVLTISVGASPQVMSIANLTQQQDISLTGSSLSRIINTVNGGKVNGLRTKLELHAGVYSLLDLQQISTNSKESFGSYDEEIAISVLAEVCSVYNDGERAQPEALIAVGVLGLGREPCASYPGWGVVQHPKSSANRRLIIDRISQEHSIVAWEQAESGGVPSIPLEVGDVVRIYPNHACITGALHGWYLIVDSTDSSQGSKIVDVWPRCSGW